MHPKRNTDMARSMLKHAEQSPHGMLPIWSHWGNENWCMIGYHAVSVLADAWKKGLLSQEQAVAAAMAIRSTASNDQFDGQGERRKLGFISCDTQGASVSKTLEMAYDDWCAAELESDLVGLLAESTLNFEDMGGQFQAMWDRSVGFMRPRHQDGAFREEFDPLSTEGQGFIEGNAWNYSLHVQQDPDWLIDSHGGSAAFVEHLETLFTMELPDAAIAHTEDVTRDGLVGCYVHGNEPSHHVPWLFALAGRSDRTEFWTRHICSEMYGPGVNGLCGNDDAGQMSAWYVFAALGFYPFCPGDERYVLGSPAVRWANLELESGQSLHIRTENASNTAVYVSRVTWNGERITTPWIRHSDLARGGTLKFYLSEKPVGDAYPNHGTWSQ
jgi:predicted alpha-1,2-mannosidase